MFRLVNTKYKNILNIKALCLDKTVVCILGQSGSGKTTVLKLFNNMISPDEGTVYFNNVDIKIMQPNILRSRVSMLPQNPVIYDGNIKENLIVGLVFQNKQIPKDDDLIKLLDDLRINKSLSEDAKNLSGGEKQRLCIARLLLLSSEVYLFDEPSSALDKGTEDFVIEFIVKYIRKNQKMMIMVTHSPDMAKKYADQIVVIEGGKVANE